MKKKAFLLLILLAALSCFPLTAYGHASLVQSSPTTGERLESSPEEVRLAFNGRLERQQFVLKVFDSTGDEIAGRRATMSQDQQQITLPLSELDQGVYTVSYRVISSDGHPVAGSYSFGVGQAVAGRDSTVVHSESDSVEQVIYPIRALFYLCFILSLGWMIWSYGGKQSERLLSVLLLAILVHALCWVVGFEPRSWQSLGDLLTGTMTGIAFLFLFALTLLRLLVRIRASWANWTWLILMCLSKSFMGHPVSHDPAIVTITANAIHLLSASIWAGGLLYALYLRQRQPAAFMEFLYRFSKAAFGSIVLLILTGTALTLIYVPKVSLLTHTAWGWLVILKIAATTLVAVVGISIRVAMRKRNVRANRLLFADLGLMLIIVVTASVLTNLNPLPENQAKFWHRMENGNMLTVHFVPDVSGGHEFDVRLDFEEGVSLKEVKLFLINMDRSEVSPLAVPLERRDLGKETYAYRAQGPYPPFSGEWKAQFRIIDSNDDETVYEERFIIFQ